ncbi:hypothetical protein GCM10010520_61610 [Rhizobium viscosum]
MIRLAADLYPPRAGPPPREDQQAFAASGWIALIEGVGAGLPVPLLVVRWQSFGSPPEAPGLVVLLDGLPAPLTEPVVLLSVALPFMLLPVPLLLPSVLLPVPDVPPDVSDVCATTGTARVRARAEVARILRNIGIAFSVGAS